jgi:hypothetical protein
MRSLRIAAVALAAAIGLCQAASAAGPDSTAKPDPAYARKLDLAHRYLKAGHRDYLISSGYLAELRAAGSTCKDDECRRALDEAYSRSIAAALPSYSDQMAILIATTFSEEELRALVTFNESPVGQGISLKEAASAELQGKLAMEFQREVLKRVGEDFCSKRPQNCYDPRTATAPPAAKP